MADSREETPEQMFRREMEVKQAYGPFFGAVSELLLRHDPMGVSTGTNTDEYDPEVVTILPRLETCGAAEDVRRVVHEEFLDWFGPDAGEAARYDALSAELWELFQAAARPGS